MARPLVERSGESGLRTRQIATAGILGGIVLVLGFTGLGFIPVPNLSGSATIMQVPAVLGGVLEGPVIGLLVGGIFGLESMIRTGGVPFFHDPSVSFLPRLFIGPVAYLVFIALRRMSVQVAAAAAGVAGAVTNTVLVVGMLVLRHYIPIQAVPPILPQAVAEAILSGIVTLAVVEGVLLYRSGRTTAPEIHGEERRY